MLSRNLVVMPTPRPDPDRRPEAELARAIEAAKRAEVLLRLRCQRVQRLTAELIGKAEDR